MLDINFIVNEYKKGKTMTQIAKELNTTTATISRKIKATNIEKRSMEETLKIVQSDKDNKSLSDFNEEIITGNLLGDGYIGKGQKKGLRAYYAHVDKNYEYLVWLKESLEKDGITFSPIHYTQNNCFYLQSHTYSVFNEFKTNFYENGKRVIPKDIVITPITLRQWYISDGSITKHSGIYIAKQDDNIEILLSQLRSIFNKTVSYHSGEKIYFPKKIMTDFFDYIGNCPVKCYEYKWMNK